MHAAAVVFALTLFGKGFYSSGEQQPPNICIFLIDDYGHTDIGYNNVHFDNNILTPNLDKIASEGVKLEKYYVQPVCTPTRSQLLSGRYQIHTGLQHGVM